MPESPDTTPFHAAPSVPGGGDEEQPTLPLPVDKQYKGPRPANDITQADTVRQPTLPGTHNGQGSNGESSATHSTTTGKAGLVQRARARYGLLSARGKVLCVVLLILLLVPLITTLGAGISALVLYSQARSGVQHLQNIQALFSGTHGHAQGYLDADTLQQTQREIDAANGDFRQLRDELDQDGFVRLLDAALPQQIGEARALSHIGVDATEIGQEVIKSVIMLAPTLRAPLLTATTKPVVTPALLNKVRSTIDFALPRLHDIELASHGLSLTALPISAHQRQQLTLLLQAVPPARIALGEARNLMGPLSWLLGVDQARTFLVQTMDRAELRATGGFTGQFGELSIHGGRIAPFNLKNIGPYEENNPRSPIVGKSAPTPYTWWPIANFGLRDANVSADFPTSARIAAEIYRFEFGKQIDGVIVFSPFLISRVLQVTGPIYVPAYKETITAQNLEQRLHYYQLDNAGIRKEELVEHVHDSPTAPDEARKLFTRRLSNMLMDHVRHAPPAELLALARMTLYALKTRDLQVYTSNPQFEHLLASYGSTNSIDRSTGHDGLYVVQSNVSVSKASQYVRTNLQDTVTLDAAGGATHVMKLRLAYTQIGPVWGWDTYRDYVRVYVPPNARFLWGEGFDTGFAHPFCTTTCRPDVFGDGTLLCPAGNQSWWAPWWVDDPLGTEAAHAINRTGPPTNMSSDETGRAMYAGWVIVPKNCNLTVSLSWYVPPTGHHPYTLLVQRQSSTLPTLDLTILPSAANCRVLQTGGLHFSGVSGDEDRTFVLPVEQTKGKNAGIYCYPQTGV